MQSVLNQTYTNFELLVVDDFSDDHTRQIVNSFEDPRIQYIRHDERRGVSAARNTGIKRARGEIIAFQDSDDEWLPGKLEMQVDSFAAANETVGVVYTGMLRTIRGNKHYLPSSGTEPRSGDIRQSIIQNNFISTQMAAVRSDCFDTVGLFDEQLSALVDWDLWIRVSEHYQFELIDKPLVKSTVRSDSISAQVDRIVNSRERIIHKHTVRFDNKSLANHLFFTGHGSMKIGNINKARRYLLKSVRLEPQPIYILALILSGFGSRIYQRVYRAVK